MTPEELVSQVFSCRHCDATGLPFVRHGSGKFFRFPPTIGAAGRAPLLFVGINPRVSESNRHLHDAIVEDSAKFVELSRNRVGPRAYIGASGLERHYALHVKVAEALFPGAAFEAVAAVTELHFCASSSSQGLPPDSSRCAERYLEAVLEVTTPSMVFAVGVQVERTLRAKWGFGQTGITAIWPTGQAPVIVLPHPNAFGPKRAAINTAIERAKGYLSVRGPE